MKRIRHNRWLGRKLWGMNKKLDEMSKQLKTMQFIDNLEREERHKRAMSRPISFSRRPVIKSRPATNFVGPGAYYKKPTHY